MKDASKMEGLHIGERLCVKIQGLGSFGEGLARIKLSSGTKEIFVPKTAPGDEVEIKIVEKKKGRFRATPTKYLKLSENRISPRCQHFESCGGCDFQHIPYSEQMAWKLRITKHWIRRSPLAPQLNAIQFDSIFAPSPYEYRQRVRIQIKNGKIHYFKPHSNELLEIKECPILTGGFFEELSRKARTLPDTKDWNQTYINNELVDGNGEYRIDALRLQFDENCFIQANSAVNALMWEKIKERIKSLPVKHKALDLYCGIGNFTVGLSRHFSEVTGIENHEKALNWARKNDPSIQWIHGESARVLMDLQMKRKHFDFVLLDPPRLGALDTCRILLEMAPPSLIYISCSLETLVRDLTALCKRQRYRIETWTVVDMFPQTHHIESIVSLTYS